MRLCSHLLLPLLCIGFCAAEEHAKRAVAPAPIAPAAHGAAGGEPAAQGFDAKSSLERLLEGNQRFVGDLTIKGHKDSERRVEVAKGQHPKVKSRAHAAMGHRIEFDARIHAAVAYQRCTPALWHGH